jgi:hypothetical protein
MIPKEKAKQLCDAFYQKLPLEMYVTTTDGDLSCEYNSWKNAKECALIAVGEVLKSFDDIMEELDLDGSGYQYDNYRYWTEVKQEIEKL